MKKIPVYVNPYDKVHFGPSTVMTLHRFGIFDPDVARRVPTLSPFSAKLTAHLRFQGIPFEPVAEQGVGNAPRGKVPFITVDGVKVADSDLVIGFLKTAFPDPDAGLSDHQRAVGHLVQRTLEDHLYWIALIYEFYDQEGSDWFFEHAFGGMGPGLQGLRDDMEDRTYKQGIARYTPDEIVDKASKDLAAVAEILGENRYLLGTDRPTSFDAVVFGMTILVYQLREMHPRLTDYARSLPNLTQYIGNLLTEFFPDLDRDFKVYCLEFAESWLLFEGNRLMVRQSVPADSVSALRESALAAAGVRGIFTNLIDGKSVGARNTLDVLDPATGELLAKVPDIERDGMDAAFAAARRAFSSWSKLTWEARRSILEKAFENVKAHREELVTLLMAEGGRPRSLALWEVAAVLDDFAPGVLAQSLPDVETTQPGVGRVTRHYAPLGVVAAISPWNLPLLLSYDKVVPALIAGNTVVLKPSFYTPLTVLRVAELVRDILPAGILNVVTGGDNVGPWMTSHPEADKISFTGSTQTGRRVFESASQTLKHLTLELGGNDAGIVLPDVDVDAAIAPIFWGMFLVNGQGCITIKRLLVHESRYDEVAAALSKFAAEQVLGDGFDPATTIGPIQNRAQLLRLQATWAAIQKDGVAVLYRGDEIEGKGNFFPVTILDNPSPHADYVKLENFGPLRSLIKYGTIDEAIEIANSTDYGLGGSVWGRDPAELDAVAHRMEAGTVWINQHLVVNPNVPFGGNKDSGFGVQYGAEGLKEYCYLRVISAKT